MPSPRSQTRVCKGAEDRAAQDDGGLEFEPDLATAASLVPSEANPASSRAPARAADRQ